MPVSKNFTAQITDTEGTVLTLNLTDLFTDSASFAEAYNNQPAELSYSIQNGDNKETGVGNFNGVNQFDRTTVKATLVGGVYNDTNPTRINLSGQSTVKVSFNAEEFNDFYDHTQDTTNPHNVTAAQVSAEPDLKNPASDGYVLSSTVAGVRSWVSQLGGGDLTDATFPTHVKFGTLDSTSINDGGNTSLDFTNSNKHELRGSGSTTIDVTTFPGIGNYIVYVPDDITITGVSSGGGKIEHGNNPFTPGVTQTLNFFYTGLFTIWSSTE